MSEIKAIYFDVGGVLLRLDRSSQRAADWDVQHGLPPDTVRQAIWGDAWKAYEISRFSEEEYNRSIAEALNLDYPDGVQRFIEWLYAGENLEKDMLALAERLRARYKVAILSNAGLDQRDIFLDKFGFDTSAAFDDHVVSAEVGMAKPDPAIYRLACERLGVALDEAVLIDDLPRNTEAAIALGMHAIVHTDYPALVAALEELLGHEV